MTQEPVSLETAVERVNAWCAKRGVRPVSGQSAEALSVRTARYYRSLGLLDPPDQGGPAGYTHRHFLQLCAVRVLQANGLPLERIQQLLYGRSNEDLQRILESPAPLMAGPTPSAFPGQPETWNVVPITPHAMVVLRGGVRLTPAQRRALAEIFEPAPKEAARAVPVQPPPSPGEPTP